MPEKSDFNFCKFFTADALTAMGTIKNILINFVIWTFICELVHDYDYIFFFKKKIRYIQQFRKIPFPLFQIIRYSYFLYGSLDQNISIVFLFYFIYAHIWYHNKTPIKTCCYVLKNDTKTNTSDQNEYFCV